MSDYTFFISNYRQGPSLKIACIFKIFRAQGWQNKQISVIFQHSSLTYCIPLVKDQSSFYEILSTAICINLKAFDWVNRKQLNILKTFSEYLEFYIAAYWRWFGTKSCLVTNYILRASYLKTDCLQKMCILTRMLSLLFQSYHNFFLSAFFFTNILDLQNSRGRVRLLL